MAIIERGQGKIDYLNRQGLGFAISEQGSMLSLPYTLPGEIVEFEKHAYRSKVNDVLINIINTSPDRAVPPCKYFGICGGCLLQHLKDNAYHQFKMNLLTEKLVKNNLYPNINPIITISPKERRRINFEAVKKETQIFLGFHRFHSHQIINIDECLAMLPKLSALLVPLKESLYHVLEAKEKAQIFLTEASNGIDIVIRIQNRTSLTLENKKILSNFAKNNSIIRMVFCYRKVTDIVYETELPFVLFDNIRVKVDAHSFLQSSAVADLILAELVLKASVLQLNPLPCSQKIVDLFCGRGTYTLPLSGKYQVDGFESDKTALRDLDIAILESKRPIKLEKRDLFLDPLDAKELEPYFFAIINPPRAGALAQSIQLASSNISRICYISCNPETFARDASIICESKYKLTEVTPLDQFYWSPHLEVIGIFDKIS